MSKQMSNIHVTDAAREWITILFSVFALFVVLPLIGCEALDWAYKQQAMSKLPPLENAPASGLRIAYECTEGPPTNTNHICVMRSDGTGQTLLTRGEGESPAWSPDGKRIAFQSYETTSGHRPVIMIMNADGTDERQLVDITSSNPVWSPDSKQIMFETYFAEISQRANVDGTGRTTAAKGVDAVWSPDGTRIAFVHSEEGDSGELPDICIGQSDGGDSQCPGIGYYPDWSPDGKHIAYACGARGKVKDYANGGICVMDVDGGNRRTLTTRGGGNPKWSPDGRQILFTPILTCGNCFEVHIINADGTGERQLATGWNADWSPDGKQIAFDDYFSVYTINADGSGKRQLAPGTFPDWSPQ